jgi:hypothetical protein
MATLNDLFGGNGGPSFYPLQQPGDKVVGVITEEPQTDVPVYDFNTKKPKFFVEVTPGVWKVLPEGQFDKDTQNHRPVHKIVVTIQTAEGKTFRIDFNTKQEREALKQEMQSTGLNLEPGVTIGKQVTARTGNNKTVAVKLVAAS